MYIIVKDVCDDHGGESEAVIVLNNNGIAEAYRTKQHAEKALEEMIKNMEEEYEIINGDDYPSIAYSLWGYQEIFYVFELYVDNRL